MTERVAVFPAASLDHFSGLPGFDNSPGSFKQFELMLEPCVGFRLRSEVEDDEKWKQIIPYTYIYNPGYFSVLGYRRSSVSGDQRLRDKWSIGFGGHVNPLDDRQGRQLMLDFATNRELQEELSFFSSYDQPTTVGFLYLESTPVDRVHFGVVRQVIFDGELRDITPRSEIAELCWIPLEDLKDWEFEGWSATVVERLQDLLFESGRQNPSR